MKTHMSVTTFARVTAMLAAGLLLLCAAQPGMAGTVVRDHRGEQPRQVRDHRIVRDHRTKHPTEVSDHRGEQLGQPNNPHPPCQAPFTLFFSC